MQRVALPCCSCGAVRQFVGKDAAKVAVSAKCTTCGGTFVTRPRPDPKTTPTSERPLLTPEELIISEQILRAALI